MDLAAIGTSGENDFVEDNISSDHWIGLSDPSLSSPWVWVSTSAPISAGYENWGTNEPNAPTRVPNCGELTTNNGRWNDTTCDTAQAFLCEQL
jgi:hypothetical protein